MAFRFSNSAPTTWLWPLSASLLLVVVSLGASAWIESQLIIGLFAGLSIISLFLMTAIFNRQRRKLQASDASLRQARAELRTAAVDLAVLGAEKLLTKNLDEPTHRKLVEDYLAGLERSAGESGTLPS